jgi:hypothetical protein
LERLNLKFPEVSDEQKAELQRVREQMLAE